MRKPKEVVLERLYDELRGASIHYLVHRFRFDELTAEDVVQNAFLYLWNVNQTLYTIPDEAGQRRYVRAVITSAGLDQIKYARLFTRQTDRLIVEDVEITDQPSVERYLHDPRVDIEAQICFHDAWEQAKQQLTTLELVLLWCRMHGLSYPQIVSWLETSSFPSCGYVYVNRHLRKARETLAAALA